MAAKSCANVQVSTRARNEHDQTHTINKQLSRLRQARIACQTEAHGNRLSFGNDNTTPQNGRTEGIVPTHNRMKQSNKGRGTYKMVRQIHVDIMTYMGIITTNELLECIVHDARDR